MLLVKLASLVLIMLGPLCGALALARAAHSGERGRPGAAVPISQFLLTSLVLWILIQACLAEALLAAQRFALAPLFCAEAALFLLGGLGLFVGRRAGQRLPVRPALPSGRAERLFLAALGGLGLYLLYLVLTRPLSDYDTLAYHLPAALGWLRRGSHAPPPGFEHSQIGAYPYAWEAVCACGLLALRKDAVVLLPNLLAWALYGLAVYRLGRELGASRAAALSASLLLLSQPLVVEQVGTLHVDLPFSALFLAGICYLRRWAQSGSLGELALAAACAALLVAIKMSGFPYVALGAAAGLGLRWHSGRSLGLDVTSPARRPVLAAAAIAVAGAWVSAFWYGYNLRRLGNPLGYIAVRLGPYVLFEGQPLFLEQVQATSLAHLFRFREAAHIKVLLKVAAYYLELPFLLLAGLAGLAIWQRRRVLWPLVLCAACAYLYWRTPYSGDNGEHGFQITTWIGQGLRYGLPGLGLLAAVAALGAEPLVRPPFVRLGLSLLPLFLCVGRVAAADRLAQQKLLVDSPAGVRTLLFAMGLAVAATLALCVLGALFSGLSSRLRPVPCAAAKPRSDRDEQPFSD